MLEGDSLVRRALDHAGYGHVHESDEALRECFRDYVDSGIWFDLSADEIDDLTIEEMCRALLALI